MSFIYSITNNIDGKVYIGVTENFEKRKSGHLCAAKTEQKPLYKAMRKHGIENFVFEILKVTDNRLEEINFIEEYNCKVPLGYNLTDGGEGNVGYKVSDETKLKQSIAAKNRAPMSEEQRRKIREANLGRELSLETRKKIGNRLKGNKNFQGHTFSDETLKVLSQQKSKTWEIETPSGEIITVHNLRRFCIENNLAPSAMSRVASKQQTHHKGYRNIRELE